MDGTTVVTGNNNKYEVEKDHNITFEVTDLPVGYEVEKWEGATENTSDKKKASLKATANATVKAIIKKTGTTPTKKDGKLTGLKLFNKDVTIDSANGPNVTAHIDGVTQTELTQLADLSECKGSDADGGHANTNIEILSIANGGNTINATSSNVKIALAEGTSGTVVTVVTKETDHFKAMTITLTIKRS